MWGDTILYSVDVDHLRAIIDNSSEEELALMCFGKWMLQDTMDNGVFLDNVIGGAIHGKR